MAEPKTQVRMLADEAVERLGDMVPGGQINLATAEDIRDGYLELQQDYDVLAAERDGLAGQVTALQLALQEAREQAAAADASEYQKALQAEVARLNDVVKVLRARLDAR